MQDPVGQFPCSSREIISLTHNVGQIMLNSAYTPLYVHCLNGSEVTGLAMMSLRKVQLWATPSVLSELMRFSESHSSFDRFLEEFVGEVTIPEQPVRWLWQGLKDEDGLPPLGCGVKIKYVDTRLEERYQQKRTEKAKKLEDR